MTDEPLAIPDFLRRPPPTEEERKRLSRMVARAQERRIKNPRKRPSKSSRLLGPVFGAKIKST